MFIITHKVRKNTFMQRGKKLQLNFSFLNKLLFIADKLLLFLVEIFHKWVFLFVLKFYMFFVQYNSDSIKINIFFKVKNGLL